MKRMTISNIKISDEEKKKIMNEIAAYYRDVRGEELGIIGQQQFMDLFLEELAPVVYNRALDDAKRWYETQQSNLESDYFMLYKGQQ